MEAALRKTSALLGKDMKDLVKNPTVLLGCLLPVGFIALYSQTMGDASGEAADAARHQFLTMALFMTVGMTGCMGMCVLEPMVDVYDENGDIIPIEDITGDIDSNMIGNAHP